VAPDGQGPPDPVRPGAPCPLLRLASDQQFRARRLWPVSRRGPSLLAAGVRESRILSTFRGRPGAGFRRNCLRTGCELAYVFGTAAGE